LGCASSSPSELVQSDEFQIEEIESEEFEPEEIESAPQSTAATAQDGPDGDSEPIATQPTSSPVPSESEQPTLLLPDAQRWVVVEDWSSSGSTVTAPLQLDVAPLDAAGVPQLGQRVSMSYRFDATQDLDKYWGDASSMGEPIEFPVGDGMGRSVHNPEAGYSMAVVWVDGTVVTVQSQDADVADLAKSFTTVDEAVWTNARTDAPAQRLIAVEAAMQNLGPVQAVGSPLPHWVFPDPWELQWVTDKTIWTAEQHAQSAAFSAANRPASLDVITPRDYQIWRYGFGDTASEAASQFAPQITVFVSVFAEAPPSQHPTNYEQINGLGLDGVISRGGGSGMSVELGTGEVRVNIRSTSALDEATVREFVNIIEFAADDPLEGLVVNDDRFQEIVLSDWDLRPYSWHASWSQPAGPDGVISVWRLSVPELRVWMLGRGDTLPIPENVWDTIASQGVVNFGPDTSYDTSAGILISLRNIERDELVPIDLDDWIVLAEPVNTDPINPR